MAKSDHHQVQKQQQSPKISNDKKKMATTTVEMKKFKGVRMRSWGSWVSEVRAPNQKTRIWLGSYSTAEAAARAYDAALICLKGSTSAAPNLNFPISSYSQTFHHHNSTTLTTPPLSPKSIQRVAAAAAATGHLNPCVPSPYTPSSSSSSSSNYSVSLSSLSPSPVSSPALDQLYDDDVSLPRIHIPPTSLDDLAWQGFDQFEQQQHYYQHHYHDDNEQLFAFDDALVSFDTPMLSDDYYYEGDIPLWSFAE